MLDTAKLQMDYAKDSFDAVEGMFSEGLLASLSLIDAEQALTFAEREVVNAGYDRELAILRLKRSVGTLGKEAADKMNVGRGQGTYELHVLSTLQL